MKSQVLQKIGIDFRHSYITMGLKAGAPVPLIAAKTDKCMKYIQEHYLITTLMNPLRYLVKVERSNQQGKV